MIRKICSYPKGIRNVRFIYGVFSVALGEKDIPEVVAEHKSPAAVQSMIIHRKQYSDI